MSHAFYEIQWFPDVFLSLILVVFSLILIRWWKIGLEKTLMIGTLRTFIQLTFMGYVLSFFFRQHHWGFLICLVTMMILVASYEGYRRQKENRIPYYFTILAGALFFTTIVVLGTILLIILKTDPWYYPYAMIPLAGMIIGNALNSVTLAINRFSGELIHREDEIEMLLSLGAPARAAINDTLKDSIRAALIPNINGMMMVGLVQLPGVMTGQILSGVDPVIAVRYQIMIMYMWITTVTIMDILVLALVYRQFFTPQIQLKRELLRASPAD